MTREVIEKYIERHREVKQGPVQLELKLHQDAPRLTAGRFTNHA